MSILDDAIREHLELKRAHGADEAEVKRLEDEAFGPAGRPGESDPFAEAPTQFMTAETIEAEAGEDSGGRRINIADLQEPPPPEQAAAPAEAEAAELPDEEAAAEEPDGERQAIAEQPTEFFDVEAAMGSEDAPAIEAPSPSDEEIVEAELSEPKLAPVEPVTEIHASRTEAPEEPPVEDEEDEEFWNEQRLSDELDQALESPPAEEHKLPPAEEREDPDAAAEPAALYEDADTEGDEREDARPQGDHDPDTGHEDVLEDTPDFLEESPEDDELWFEQKPPKDFDFDD
jgi:hypothetical protein